MNRASAGGIHDDIISGRCPGNSKGRVFSAGTKIVVAINLENTVWQGFMNYAYFF
jgi:hypothetical protein